MDKDPETLEEAIEQIKRWRELYCAKLQEISEMNEELYRIRAEARAEAHEEYGDLIRAARATIRATDRVAFAWKVGKCGPLSPKSCYIPDIARALEQLRAAILADEPKEERRAEGPCCKCVEEKGAPPCEFCGPPAWEAFLERESSWEPMVRALIGLLPRRERRWLKGVVDAEVERRIEEAGR